MPAFFVCDINLPPRLVAFFRERNCEAVHAYDLGFATAGDETIWDFAREHDAIVITKDSDFTRLGAAKPGPRLVLVCTGNCSNETLFAKLSEALPEIIALFQAGSRMVELR
jgi:predicted nuclease of predicted toxin-antitoxin system